jgi:DnaK suppressor protein
VQPLKAEEVLKLKDILVQERDSLLSKANERVNGGAYQISRDDLADDGDKASIETEQDVGMTLAEHERNKLSLVERALRKIESGDSSYGICEGTGEPIGFHRLSIQPWVLFSLRYQEELEKGRR